MNYSNYRKHDFRGRKSVALESVEVFPSERTSWTISHQLVAPLAMALDALIILIAGIAGCVVYQLSTYGNFGNITQYAGLAAVAGALLITLGNSAKLYASSALLNFKLQVRQIILRWLGILLFLATAGFAMKIGENFSRGATALFVVFGLGGLIGMRAAWRLILADGLAVRKFAGRNVILVADQASAIDSGLLETLKRHGMQLAHHFVLPANYKDKQAQQEVIAQAVASLRRSHVEEIVVAANLDRWPEIRDVLSGFRVLPLPVNFVPVGPTKDLFYLPSHLIGETVTIELQRGPRTLVERFITRTMDIAVAGSALALLLPLFVMTAIAIRLDSPGPVIFRQRRCGFNGRMFYIFKFRTMSVMEDGEKVVAAKIDDDRITRIGKWLRRTSIDELPQLLNVLQGSMSIVGPRPHAVAHDDEFDQLVGNYAFRQHVKPGITGWAQVHGLRGEARTVADIEERIRSDLWYIDNWSLALDLRIILMTVFEVLRGKNAY